MSVKPKLDPHSERFRSRGPLVTLAQLLLQRHAAKTLTYLSQAFLAYTFRKYAVAVSTSKSFVPIRPETISA